MIEIRNNTKKKLHIAICRAKLSGNIYVEIDNLKTKEVHKGKICEPNNYCQPEINKVNVY